MLQKCKGEQEGEQTEGPAGKSQSIPRQEWVHAEASQHTKPRGGEGVPVGQKGEGQGGQQDGLLMHLEGEEKEG